MLNSHKILFGRFPRTVAAGKGGTLSQHCVHSESEFDLYFNTNRPKNNIYGNISRFRYDMRLINGNFAFDFDAPLKDSIFDEEDTDRDKIQKMRLDEELTQKVLGIVWSDVQSLVEKCVEEDIPVMTVFSGLGVHCHVLFQEQVNPFKEKLTTSKWLIEECDLKTHDRKVMKDMKRVLRIPNSQRIDEGGPCGTWCIPMSESEVLNNDVHGVLQRSAFPKDIEYHDRYKMENRPKMQVHESVDIDDREVQNIEVEDRDVENEVPNNVEYIVETCIPLPCIRERVLQSNPDHRVRFSAAAHLLQAGFHPDEVIEILSKIGWVDFDQEITSGQVYNIYNNGYSPISCSSLQTHGLCVYDEMIDEYSNDPTDCETYGYNSSEITWN